MTISGFLPQRWRPTPEIARHAEAIAGVLHTAPLAAGDGGLTIATRLGTVDVLPFLVAVKSLHHRLGRGRVAIIDDGTLTGEDRAILAHHCGDPEILAHRRAPHGGPAALLQTILHRRAGRYWIALDPHTVTLGDIPEIDAALAGNRGFALVARPDGGGAARRSERRIAVLCGTRGWRYRSGCAGLAGFAAGGGGSALTGAFLSEVAALELDPIAAASAAMNLVLANEPEAAELPGERYRVWRGGAHEHGAALVHFPARHRFAGEAYRAASAAAIAQLPR